MPNAFIYIWLNYAIDGRVKGFELDLQPPRSNIYTNLKSIVIFWHYWHFCINSYPYSYLKCFIHSFGMILAWGTMLKASILVCSLLNHAPSWNCHHSQHADITHMSVRFKVWIYIRNAFVPFWLNVAIDGNGKLVWFSFTAFNITHLNKTCTIYNI